MPCLCQESCAAARQLLVSLPSMPSASVCSMQVPDWCLAPPARLQGLPQTCARYLGVHAACATGLEPQLFAADDPNAITEWRLLRLP